MADLESKHHEQYFQFENEFKEQVLKVSTEEIKNLSNSYQKHFEDVTETVNRLQNDLENKTRLVSSFYFVTVTKKLKILQFLKLKFLKLKSKIKNCFKIKKF